MHISATRLETDPAQSEEEPETGVYIRGLLRNRVDLQPITERETALRNQVPSSLSTR